MTTDAKPREWVAPEDANKYGWEGFDGTRNDWAWWWLDFHYKHHAKNDDDIETEVFCDELCKTKEAYDALAAKLAIAVEALESIATTNHGMDCDDLSNINAQKALSKIAGGAE